MNEEFNSSNPDLISDETIVDGVRRELEDIDSADL